MSRTAINVSGVIGASGKLNSAILYVCSASNSLAITKNGIDGKIKKRYDINNRLDNVKRQLSDINTKIGRIKATVNSSAEQYRMTDERVTSWLSEIRNNIGGYCNRTVSGNWLSYFNDEDIIKLSSKKFSNENKSDKR